MFLTYLVVNNKYQNINQILKQEFNLSARLQHKLILNKHVFLNSKIIDTRSSVLPNDMNLIRTNKKN